MIHKSLLLVMEMSTAAPASRAAFFGLIGVLLAILGIAVVLGLMLRRRMPPPRAMAQGTRDRSGLPVAPPPVRLSAGGGAMSAAVDVHVAEDAKACPSCRREFQGSLQYCPYDARKLVAAPELVRKTASAGNLCTTCRRAFDPGVKFCPHDGNELVSMSLYEQVRGPAPHTGPTGVMAKVCPQCQRRHDYAARFCGRDGAELVVLN